MMRKILDGLAILSLLVAPAFGDSIKLDIGPDGSTVQSGWTGLFPGNSYTQFNPVNLGGGVTAGFYGSGLLQDRTRGTTSPLNGLGYDDVLIDFIRIDSGGSDLDHSFLIKGLADGQYNVTLYSFDGDYGSAYHFTPTVNGTTLSYGPPASGDLSTARATALVTLSSGAANNVITIYDAGDHSAEGHGILLNGITVDAVAPVPEPATLMLLGTGAAFGLGYIRRRMTK